MTATDEASPADLPDGLLDWVGEELGATAVHAERRSGGAPRAGYAIAAELPDRSTAEYWLRVDTGAGPQSGGDYTVRKEAAVYRQLLGRGLAIAEVVAVHPTIEAFLMKRLYGRNWFSELTDEAERASVATALMEQLACLHRIDVHDLELPELGPVSSIRDHVLAELDIWERQFREHDEPEPTIELAVTWLRRNLPDDGDWPLVLVHGDFGPGNFMFDGGRFVAVTDWELAHYGDLHDDLGWTYVHDLMERLPDLLGHLADYERASGYRVDPDRLRYFLVLAQARCAIGTRRGLLARDSRGEIASHLLYTTLHTRALADALAQATGTDVAPPEPLPDPGDSSMSWMFDVALEDLRQRIVPAIGDGFASRRAKGVARLLKYLREQERLADVVEAADRSALSELLGQRADDTTTARRELCRRIRNDDIDIADLVTYCVRDWARRTEVLRPAMGALADRTYAPLPAR